MNIFIIHSGADRELVLSKLNEMKRSSFSLNPLMLGDGGVFLEDRCCQKD